MLRADRYSRLVNYLLLSALLLLLVIQGFWLRYTWQLKEKDFDEKVRLALRVYGNFIQEDSTLTRNMRAVWTDSTRLPQTGAVLHHSLDTFLSTTISPTLCLWHWQIAPEPFLDQRQYIGQSARQYALQDHWAVHG
ncbi:hypothetical protein [Paraflavitalea speifideaquila]|uniref:hypothetical protein n=1 Tax=Paraflavitalea speifideaquila TaxID=3076558 RepID=UPI0028EF1149|nr:hypothetical protein [Paraflavitalea speifideiaquila]